MSSKQRRWLRRHTNGSAKHEASVLIATPMMQGGSIPYICSLFLCQQHCHQHGIQIGYLVAEHTALPTSRQQLADAALEQGWSHILFVDSDTMFPPDVVPRLLAHHRPIVAANYMSRRFPHYMTACGLEDEEILTREGSTGLERVLRAGTGVMLISVEVFRKLQAPWFEYEWLPELRRFKSEDYGFCQKATAAGFEIYIDHDVSKQVVHWGTVGLNASMRPGFKALEDRAQQAEMLKEASHARPEFLEDKDAFMAECIRMAMEEGMDHDQAVAMCNAKWEDKQE